MSRYELPSLEALILELPMILAIDLSANKDCSRGENGGFRVLRKWAKSGVEREEEPSLDAILV